MTYSTGQILLNKQCECLHNYRWEAIEGQCVAAAADYRLVVGLCIGIPVAVLALAIFGFGIFIWEKKRRRDSHTPASQKLHPKKPAPSKSVENSAKLLIISPE